MYLELNIMNQGCLWLNSKGQAFMPDFIGSILVFSVVLSIFLFSWNSVQINQQKFDDEENLRKDAYYTTTFLVSTPGYPSDWDSDNVQIPGFASESDNVISTDKLREFRNITLERQKRLLGVENFYLRFNNETGVIKLDSENLSFGKEPVNASTAIPINRQVLISKPGNMMDAQMRYVVWE